MPRRKHTTGKFSVFKGREAKLNHAIFQILALKGSQTIYDIYKKLRTRRNFKRTSYATVNKRIRSLEESNFIKSVGVKRTKAGFESVIYELTTRAYLVTLLNSINLEKLTNRVDEETATVILGDLMAVFV